MKSLYDEFVWLISEIGRVAWDVVYDLANHITNLIVSFFKVLLDNTELIINIMYISLPYIMLKVGNQVYSERGYLSYGGEVFIPILFLFIIFTLNNLDNRRKNVNNELPIPNKRFTIVDGSKIEVENERLEELLIYMQELEDYLEDEKFLNNKTGDNKSD